MTLQPAYKPGLMEWPNQGPRCLEYLAALPASGTFADDLWEEMSRQEIAFIQAIWIDNSLNASAFQITFAGMNRGQTIVVQPFHQGLYPVSAPVGSLRFVAVGAANVSVPMAFYNCAMPYYDVGPAPGVLATPALVKLPVNFATVIGNTTIVPAVAGKFASIYRLQISADNPCVIKFNDGVTDLTGPIPLFAGGSITWQASGVSWIDGAVGNPLNINSDTAAVNIGGLVGYTLT